MSDRLFPESLSPPVEVTQPVRSRTRLGLRTRIYLLIASLVLITLGLGAIMFWYTYQMRALFSSLIERDIASLKGVVELENDLVQQKGFVSYYLLDGNPNWLSMLQEYRRSFGDRLSRAIERTGQPTEQEILRRIEAEYDRYVAGKDEVIRLYKAGEREAGEELHQQVRQIFFSITDLMGRYKSVHEQRIRLRHEQSDREAGRLRVVAVLATSVALVLFTLLTSILVQQVLGPIRQLARETDRARTPGEPANEVAALSRRVHGLIEDRNLTQTELERSRQRLVQSEKMALVGKLAAEVAHTIRNPMTSIKMRLFSLERSLQLSPAQKEDLDVISQETRHLDNVVKNFLEFSRPPKLRMQPFSISEVVDMSLQLLQKRFEVQGVRIERRQSPWLPDVYVDPEAIKEVLVNLMINACDAMKEGGSISIAESDGVAEHMGRVVLVSVSDTGPGVPAELWEKVWEPFFSTKEEGTGLGLAIALRIVEEHGGRLELRGSQSKGATFDMTLPVYKEEV
ncbi:MAG: ATP-binding protein [bacterium]